MELQWILISYLALSRLGQCAQIIPPLYRYDDFTRCRQEDSSGVFCFVKVVLNEERQSFDSPRLETDFRHNLLDWGICISNCQRELGDICEEKRQKLFQPKFQINFTYILPADHWGTYVETLQQRYGTLINVCVNNRLERKYNLSRLAYSEIEYCTMRDDLEPSSAKTPRLLVITFYSTILLLFAFILIANMVDWIGRNQARGFFRTNIEDLPGTVYRATNFLISEHIVVSSFSVRRNWSLLVNQSKTEIYRDFSYVDGLRVFLNFYLLVTHIVMIIAIMPTENPEYSEQIMKNSLAINIMALTRTGVQLFFVISGLLLTVTILQDMKRKPQLGDGYFRTKIRNRLIRVLPVYYFCLLFTLMGDELPGVQLGPVGYKSLIQEQGRCRKKWWVSMLLVSNLAVFGSLLLLVTLGKYPKRAKAILWTCAIITLIVPTSIGCYLGLESSLPIKLSDVQYGLMHQPWFNTMYTPFYTNMNSYMAGVIVGYLYHQTKHHNLNLDNSTLYASIKKLCLPLLATAYLTTFIFYQYEIPRSSWLTVLHSVLYLNAAVIAQSVCFIECFRNPPGRIRTFLSSSAMTSLGKLVFCVYVLHISVIRLFINRFTPEYNLNLANLPSVSAGIALLSYLVGFVGFFTIEQPLGLLLKHWFDGGRTKIKVL